MPYEIRKNDQGKWEVVSEDSGRVLGTHDTRKEAREQQQAIYASTDGEDKGS